MKKLYSLVIVILAFNVSASDVPTNPPSPCYEGCTQTQEDLVNEFHAKGVLPERTPAAGFAIILVSIILRLTTTA